MRMNRNSVKDYWFTIEPYVYCTFADLAALLYNTLDGATIHVSEKRIIRMLRSLYDKENCGVLILKGERFEADEGLLLFIRELRENFMGDITDTSLMAGKPIQLMPLLNLQIDVKRAGKKSSIPIGESIMQYLQEVAFRFDPKVSIPASEYSNIINQIPWVKAIRLENLFQYANWKQLLPLLNSSSADKIIIVDRQSSFDKLGIMLNGRYSFEIKVCFPLEESYWNAVLNFLLRNRHNITLDFQVSFVKDVEEVEKLVEMHGINNHTITPNFNGRNFSFFANNVFIGEEDILSEVQSMREIFAHQALNTNDFGRLTIGANGDVYANPHFPALGNIVTHSIAELLVKEMTEGKSWLRIRDQAPCNQCVYQWLCPSPSDYELLIGKPNLCHVRP